MPPEAGYSGTPLAKKLGIKAAARLLLIGAPPDFEFSLDPLPDGVTFQRTLTGKTDLVHLFVTSRASLHQELERIRQTGKPDITVWVSWPKKSAKVPTDVTEDVIRQVALPMGWVDVKVCAVDEIWSGLKLVVRKSLR
jgi:hypothetical protein